ncbi:MAG: hypothetical protein ACJ8AI_30260, partial [Rhodopila sp.]
MSGLVEYRAASRQARRFSEKRFGPMACSARTQEFRVSNYTQQNSVHLPAHFFGGDAMLKRLAVAMLCLYASGAYAQQAAGASGKPTDARSYCQKMKSIEGLPEYATKLVAIRQAVVAAGKEDRTRIAAYFRPYAQGVDDPNRTLSKRVLERINTAVPRKDAYNQDTAVQNYAEWFAACASEMRSEHGLSPGVAVFLNPLAPEVPKFFDVPPGNKAQAMREFLGPPGLGSLNDREIEARTGLAFNGINPRWVLPLAIAMDGSGRFLPPYVKQAIASIGGFSQATVKAAQERQSIAQGTHPACQRIESSPLVARFVAAVQAGYTAKANTDPMNSLAGLRFDNRQGELTALIKRRVAEAAGSGGRPDMTRQSQPLQQYNIILENCAVRNVDSDTFLFFAANVTTRDRVEQQREQTRRGGG